MSQRILVHVDAHHDLWRVPAGAAIHIANFVGAALRDALVREVYWVVPDRSWASAANRWHVLRHLVSLAREYPRGRLPAQIGKRQIHVRIGDKRLSICSLGSLPAFHESVLLDLDIDFLVIPRVTYGKSDFPRALPWCWPEELVGCLAARGLRSDLITIAYSVEGGYTPLDWKFLGDELALRLQLEGAEGPSLRGMKNLREGALAIAGGNFDSAGRKYREAAELLPHSAAPPWRLAQLCLDRGELDRAQAFYRQALALDPSYRTLYNSAGLLHYREKRFAAAEREFRRAQMLDPHDPCAMLGLGWMAAQRQYWNDAEALFRQAIESDEVLLDAHRALGEVLARQKQYAAAAAAYERSLRLALGGCRPLDAPILSAPQPGRLLDPGHWRIYLQLARLEEHAGRLDAAVGRYRMAAAGGYDGVFLRGGLARLHLLQGNWPLAAREAAGSVRLVPRALRAGARLFLRPLRRAIRFLRTAPLAWKLAAAEGFVDSRQRFRRLSRAERGWFFQALWMMPLTAVGLWLVGFRRWRAVLAWLSTRAARAEPRTEVPTEQACLAARMVQAAERWGVVRPNCLERSLVLWWLLRRERILSELHIGARKQEGVLKAHAWVECAGVVLNDSDDVHRHFARFQGSNVMAGVEPL